MKFLYYLMLLNRTLKRLPLKRDEIYFCYTLKINDIENSQQIFRYKVYCSVGDYTLFMSRYVTKKYRWFKSLSKMS